MLGETHPTTSDANSPELDPVSPERKPRVFGGTHLLGAHGVASRLHEGGL